MDRQHYFDTDGLHMDASVIESDYTFEQEQSPKRRRGKRACRKWREIEAIQAERELAKELSYYDLDFDLSDDD